MAKSIKHYVFAALALTGVYSAQLSVGLFSHEEASRTIAQVESVELTLENVVQEIHKRDKLLKEKADQIRSEVASASTEMSLVELRELNKSHKQIEKEFLAENSAFESKVESLVAAQEEGFDRFAIDEAFTQLRHTYALVFSAFDFDKIQSVADETRDLEAIARDEKIQKLQSLVCEQRLEVRSLKDELSAKLEELRELLSSQQAAPQAPSFISPFTMPFFQSPFQMSLMNPMWMSPYNLGYGYPYAENNLYGQTSFHTYGSMPMMQPMAAQPTTPGLLPQQMRGPSQVEEFPLVEGNLFIPSYDRSNGLGDSFIF